MRPRYKEAKRECARGLLVTVGPAWESTVSDVR